MKTKEKLAIATQYALPKTLLSRLVGHLAAAELGPITTYAIKGFIKHYGIDMSEAEYADPAHYRTFNQFFTRPLRVGVRPVVEDSNTVALPVDGCVSQLGRIDDGELVQAKGHRYTLSDLLADQPDLVDLFDGGDFATIYLAPKDYHRIHMPLTGQLESMVFVPGELFSVNPLTAANVPNLFARNERVIATFKTEFGPMALVLVGATIVASIETVWAGTVAPNSGQVQRWNYPNGSGVTLEKGAEMGRFKLGSTVVALFGEGTLQAFNEQLAPGVVTRMGAPFGQVAEQN